VALSIGRGTLLGMGYITMTADTAAAEESLGGFGKVAAGAAVGVLALGAAAATTVVMANTFNNVMKTIQTQAGGSAKDVKVLTTAVLGMKDAQQGPDALAEALYHLKSVGLDNTQAMVDLKQASDLAAVGGSNLEATTNALAGAWRSGIAGAQTFAMAAGTVNAIIGAGNMKMTDFVSAIGTGILPAAKTFGVSLAQIGASIALMTDEGVPAVDAATRLKMSLSLLAAPSSVASKQLATIGLTGLQLANEMRSPAGLVGTIGLLKAALDKSGLSLSAQAILLSKAFGGGRSSSAILTMVNNYSVLQKKLVQIQSTSGNLAASEAAQQATMSAQIRIFEDNVQSAAISIGEKLIPVTTQFFSFVNESGLPALAHFTSDLGNLIPINRLEQDTHVAEGFLNSFIGSLTQTKTKAAALVDPDVLFGTLSTSLAPQAPTNTDLSSAKPPVGLPLAGGLSGMPLTSTSIADQLGKSFGSQIQKILLDFATAAEDVGTALTNVSVAATPLVLFMAGTGFQTIKSIASITSTALGPALVDLSQFILQNKGVITTFIQVALIPLGIRLAALAIIKPIVAITSLAVSIVKFPFQQSALIWSGITTGIASVQSALDTMYLKYLFVSDSLSSGATAVRGAVSSAWLYLSGKVSDVGDSMFVLRGKLIALSVWDGITTAVSNLGNTMFILRGRLIAMSVWDGISTAVFNLGNSMIILRGRLIAVAVWDGITTAITGLADGTALAAVNTALFNDSLIILRGRLIAMAVWDGIAGAVTALADGTALAAVNNALFSDSLILLRVRLIGLAVWEGIAGAMTALADGTALAAGKTLVLAAAQGIATVATGALTLAQGALDVVLDANPITLVVIALVALGVGFYEAWEHSQTFRSIVLDTFSAVETAAKFMWSKVLEPYFNFIIDLWLTVAEVIVKGAADAFGWVPGLGGKLKTAAAAINSFKNDVNASMGGIRNKTFTASVDFAAVANTGKKGLPGLAAGGPVRGPGTATSDSVVIAASTGEHVWTAAEVQSAGGHGAVANMRGAAVAGALPAFATGGPVGGFDVRVARPTATQISAAVLSAVSQLAQTSASSLYAAMTTNAGGFSGTAVGPIQQFAQSLLAGHGWGANQMGPLIKLWNQESGWNPDAVNASSGAYGIPQALGHGHPYNLGDYKAQVVWGENYIAQRYGSPAAAWSHEVADNWYDKGGWLMPGTTVAHNGTGKPERVVGPGESAGGGDTYNFHFHGPVGSQQELENWLISSLQAAKQKGRLRSLTGP
jgi:TP901 family phage tail tape measure protein